MRVASIVLFSLSFLYAACLSITQSLLTESAPLMLLGGLGLLALTDFKTWRCKWSMKSFLFIIPVLYFFGRALFSPVFDFAEQDLVLITASSIIYFWIAYASPKLNFSILWSVVALIIILNMLMFLPSLSALRNNVFGGAIGDWNTGLYNHRNFFANMMMMCSLVMSGICLLSHYSIILRMMFGALAIISATGVILSLNRAGLIGLAGGLFVLLVVWLLKEKKRKGVIISVVAPMLLIIGVFLFSTVYKQVLESRGLATEVKNGGKIEKKVDSRLYYFAMAVDQFLDEPLLGNGARSYVYKSYENYSVNLYYASLNHGHVHNEFLQVLCEYGIIGFLILIVFLIYHLGKGYSLIIEVSNKEEGFSRNRVALLGTGIAVVTGSLLNMLLSFPAHCLPNLMLFSVAIAIIGRGVESKNVNHSFSSLSCKSCFAVIIVGLSIFSISTGWKQLQASIIFMQSDIIVDDLNWEDVEKSSWKQPLVKVNEIAPNYDRLNKLGYIYLEEYTASASKEEREDKWKRALELFKESKKRHPYGPVARVNIAWLLKSNLEYEKAALEYEAAEVFAKNREYYFQFYQHWANNCRHWANELWEEGSTELAIKKLEEGLIYIDKSKKASNDTTPSSLAEEEFRISKMLLLLYRENNQDAETLAFIEERFRPLSKGRILYMTDLTLLSEHADIMFQYSHGLWFANELELSKEIIKEVLKHYKLINRRIGLTELQLENQTIMQNILLNIKARL